MRLLLCLLVVSCAFASEDEGRAKKPPFVVDAVGNTLPPPSNVPATVGSPVNLISPDRYEFYTFDESGELVKRLMTLAQIQAIVAAGEEAEGLVTFANDNQPTVAFNFSQPSHNKVHSVVTNVQNVLKAQMEAHKKNPLIQPALDTPDVSDSWSLILPSIFGNTGLDIVPDKTPNAVTPPETDTLEFHDSNFETNDISFSKEGNNEILSSSTTTENNDSLKHITTIATSLVEEDKATPTTTEKSTPTTTKIAATTSTTTTTAAPPKTTLKTTTTTTTTTNPPSTTSTTTLATTKATERVTTTLKPLTTKATVKLTTAKDPQTKLTTLTTKEKIKLTSTTEPSTKPFRTTEVSSTTKLAPTTTAPTLATKTRATTSRPYVSSTSKLRLSTTVKPAPTTKSIIKFTPKITTFKPSTTKKHFVTTTTTPKLEININNNEVSTSNVVSTENNTVQYEKKSTYIPISTATYITERTTQKPQTARPTIAFINTTQQTVSTTTAQPSTTSQKNLPVITTYKPTTTESAYVSSTAHNQDSDKLNATTITTQSVSPSTTVSSTEFLSNEHQQEIKHVSENLGNYNKEPDMPLFDVAQSISQIASDLGSNYIPLPTVSNIDVSTTLNDMDLESKENIEMDILTDIDSNLPKPNVSESDNDNFVKISTIDPHPRNENKATTEKDILSDNINSEQSFTTEKNVYTTSTLESTTIDRIMSESMGDLLFQVVNQAPQSIVDSENKFDFENNVTTETSLETTTNDNVSDFTTTTIEPLQTDTEKYQTGNDIPEIQNRISELTTSIMTETTEISIIEKEVNSTENEKTEEVGNTKYVQISASAAVISTESDIKPEFFFVSNETENKSVKNNDSTVLESTKKEEVNIATLTNKTQNIESSTTDSTLLINMKQEIKNKTSIVDANKNKKNDQLPLLLPKIDEFKKKIQKVNIDDKELANDRNNSWKLISTVSPPKSNEIQKTKEKNNGHSPGDNNSNKDIILNFSKENQGLEVTTKDLEEDIAKFTELCNELAFRYWNTMIENIDKRRSFVLSPYSITSMLAMMFMGARGATSGEMNDILKLDDMVTFNPHFTLKNISDSIETTPESGVIVSAFIRELYSDRTKGKILTFYKERAQQFYNGHVEEINFKLISDIIRRRTNLLVKRYTWGKISEYMKSNTITMQPPLAAFSANIFQTDCSGSSVEGRDGEMYFVVSPTVRQRRLVPVPAVVYRSGFLAGYDPVLDATAAALGKTSSIISTLFVMPGQQGNVVHGEDLEALEQRLLDANPTTPAWNRLLRTLLPRIGLELQIPRFSHKSIFNVSDTLRDMGLKDLFDSEHADLGGLNGPSKDLYLSDMIQSTTFVTCGEDVIGEQHHVEEYPETLGKVARRRSTRWTADWSEPRDYQRAFHDPHDVGEAMHLPLHLRPRQARLPSRNAQPTRLKFDRPFLYFVRHNPSGMILYVGRYNPRLLP